MDLVTEAARSAPFVPEILRWVLTIAALSLAWAVIAIPAYLMGPLIRETRQNISTLAKRLSGSLAKLWRAPLELASAFELFYKSHQFYEMYEEGKARWQETISGIRKPLLQLRSALTKAKREWQRLGDCLSQATRRLDRVPPSVPGLPNLEGGTALQEQFMRVRRARATIWIVSVFLVALLLVNTGMLSQILRGIDVGVIRIIGGLWLYHVLALLLTLIEGAVGVAHAHFGVQEPEEQERTYLLQPVLVLFAVLLAFVEGFFYSRVGDPQQAAEVPFVDVTLNMQQAFFIWGFMLPLVLALLGYIWFRSIIVVRDGHSLEAMHRELERLADLRERTLDVGQVLERVRASLSSSAPALSGPSIDAVINDSMTKLDQLKGETPPWAAPRVARASEAVAVREAQRIGAWLLVTILSVGFLVWIHREALTSVYPAMARWLVWGIACSHAAALLAAGMFLRASPVAVSQNGVLQPLGGARGKVGRWLGLGVVLLVIGFDLFVFLRELSNGRQGTPWIVVVALGLLLVVVGRELASMLTLAACCVRAGLRLARKAIALLAVGVAVATIRALLGLFLVTEFILNLLALPATALLQRLAKVRV